MPKKENLILSPDKFGLSERDIMYLLVFRELANQPASPSELHEITRAELREIDRGRARSYMYQVVNQMEAFGWIIEVPSPARSNKKYFSITTTGKNKVQELQDSCLESIQSLKKAGDHFAYLITGTGSPAMLDFSTAQRKMFSRLINVRHLSRYLFLRVLSEPNHKSVAGKEIWGLMKELFQWQPAQGYFYELAHEMETDLGYIQGSWTTSRRNHYLYRLTDVGAQALDREAEATMFAIHQLQKYTAFILRLFPSNNPSSF